MSFNIDAVRLGRNARYSQAILINIKYKIDVTQMLSFKFNVVQPNEDRVVLIMKSCQCRGTLPISMDPPPPKGNIKTVEKHFRIVDFINARKYAEDHHISKYSVAIAFPSISD